MNDKTYRATVIVFCTLLLVMLVVILNQIVMSPGVERSLPQTLPLKPHELSENVYQESETKTDRVTMALEIPQFEQESAQKNPHASQFNEVVLAKIEELNNQIFDLQTRIQYLSQSDFNDTTATMRPDPQSIPLNFPQNKQISEKERLLVDKIFTETYQALNQEAYDADWSSSVSESITNLISTHQLSDVFINDILCGTTLCTVSLTQSQGNTDSANILLENLAQQDLRLRVRHQNAIDGTGDIELLIGRDSRPFGFNEFDQS